MNQNRLLQDYFGRRPYPGTGVLEDYMQPAPQYAGPAMPVQRLGLSPQAEMGVSRYMNLDGGRGFSRANAERLYAQELDMQAQQEQEQALLNARAAEQAVTQVDPLSPQYSQQLTGILGRYGQAAVPALKGILPLQEVLRKAAQPDDARDPYLNKITDPRAFQSYRQRRSSGMAPEQAWEQTLVETEEDDLMTQALQAGVPLADVQGMRQNGRLDKYKVLEALSSAKRGQTKPLSAEGYNRILSAEDALEAATRTVDLSEDNKKAVFKKEFKRLPETPEDWDRAYELANRDVRKAQDRLETLTRSYGSQYQLPPDLQGRPAPAATQPVPTDPFATPTGPTTFGPQGDVPPVAMPPSKSVATETITTPEGQVKESTRITDSVTKGDLTETDKLSAKLSDDDVQAYLVSGQPDNPENPLDVEQSAQAQALELANLMEKSGLEDNPANRRKVLLAVEAKSQPNVVRLGGKIYKFKDAQTAQEFRKKVSA
jgi:hypothetical protein